MSNTIIAYDPGSGNTKVKLNGKTVIIQTAVSRPRNIGMAMIGMKSAARNVPIVEIDGEEFAVGAGSWTKGAPITSMDYSILASPERRAILYAALSKMDHDNLDIARDATFVIGLPVYLLADLEQAQAVIATMSAFKGEHSFKVDGVVYHYSVSSAMYLSQAAAPAINWMYDDELKLRPGAAKAEIAVIGIGMNTLEMYALQGGRVIEQFVGGDEVGVRLLLEMMRDGDGHDLVETDAAMRAGTRKPTEAQLDAWLARLLAPIKSTFPSLKRFNTVILTGYGSVVLGDRLASKLTSRGAAIYRPENPLTDCVDGLYKFGLRSA